MNSVEQWRKHFEWFDAPKSVIDKYAALADAQIRHGVPVILDFEHLCLLLGRNPVYLAGAIHGQESFWRSFSIAKRSGGRREITVPYNALLQCQKWIYTNILATVAVSGFCHGFVKGKSIISNTRWHLKQNDILKIDLKDFFPSIGISRIVDVFRSLGYSKDVAFFLARLCTYDDVLPQGAPTSPCLSNIIARRLDSRVSRLAKAYGCRYTRYADDMTFSGKKIKSDFITILSRIIEKEGFIVNRDKLRLYHGGKKRIVTGVNVTDRLGIPREMKRELRKEFHFVKKYGLIDHIQRSNIKKKNYLLSLIGRFNFWLMVEPNNEYTKNALAHLQGLAKMGLSDW